MANPVIRVATAEDVPRLLAIYAPYVTDTAVSFETSVPEKAEFLARMQRIQVRYPYLVAEQSGQLLGYCYASPFKERAAYDWAVETTIYVQQECRRQGIGRALYCALAEALTEQGVQNSNACIAAPAVPNDPYLTLDSQRFHAAMGYHMVGTFHQCGWKFGRWYDMCWMERHLGEHSLTPPPVRPFVTVQAAWAQRQAIHVKLQGK